eukprot:5791795-Prymnesium_polylepis.1
MYKRLADIQGGRLQLAAERLSSSTTSGTKVDVVITSIELSPPSPPSTPPSPAPSYLASYLRTASTSASAIFDTRSTEKSSKHLAGCIAANRSYFSVVSTTLGGIGPDTARDWLDSLYRTPYARELASGGTGAATTRRRLDFIFRPRLSIKPSRTAVLKP